MISTLFCLSHFVEAFGILVMRNVAVDMSNKLRAADASLAAAKK